MFGNNIGSPFITPTMSYNIPMTNPMPTPMMSMNTPGLMGMRSALPSAAPRSGFLSSLFGGRGANTGLLSGTKTFNFGNLLNNTSKALGVVKDAIPIVKEVGPMMNNMRSMLKIASIFKDETDTTTRNNTSNNITTTSTEVNTTNKIKNDTRSTSIMQNELNNNEPNFFL